MSKERFINGFFLLSFDLTSDHSADCSCSTQQISDGIISIHAKLSKALPEPITIILYAEYDATLEVSLNRQIVGPY